MQERGGLPQRNIKEIRKISNIEIVLCLQGFITRGRRPRGKKRIDGFADALVVHVQFTHAGNHQCSDLGLAWDITRFFTRTLCTLVFAP